MGTRSDANAVFGPVSTITTAPVSMGNSVQGSAPIVHQTRDGVRVQGRDFMLQLAAVNSVITNWVLVGGCPLVPHSFVASILRSYASIYAEFVVHGFSFHYVTSSPTNAVGDIMFYVNKDRGNSLLDTTNGNFMSVVLSDPNTVIGPLWKNNSATYTPVFKTYTNNLFNDADLREQGPGELFIYSKSGAENGLGSPGYVLVDFDITFKTLQTNPRELLFPISRLKYTQYGLGLNTVGIITGATAQVISTRELLDGTTSILTADSNATIGDIYKIVMCPQFGSFGSITAATLLRYAARYGTEAEFTATGITVDDGFTCYGVFNGVNGGTLALYPSFASALSQQFPYQWNTTGTVSFGIPCWLSLVGSVGPSLYLSNY